MLLVFIHLTKQGNLKKKKKIKLQMGLSNSLSSPLVLKPVFPFIHSIFQDQQILITKSLMS